MKRPRLTFLALAAIITMRISAQQSITVKDSMTQEPIAYTSVWFGDAAGGYTDESGKIEIPEGTARIRLSHICYETKTIPTDGISEFTVFLVKSSQTNQNHDSGADERKNTDKSSGSQRI